MTPGTGYSTPLFLVPGAFHCLSSLEIIFLTCVLTFSAEGSRSSRGQKLQRSSPAQIDALLEVSSQLNRLSIYASLMIL